MHKQLLFCLGLLWSAAALAQPVASKPAITIPTKWATIKDTTYTMRFPETWTPDQSGMFGSRFFLFSPLDSLNDKFRENFNLVLNNMSAHPEVTLEYLADGAKQQVESMINDVKVHEFRIVNVDGGGKYYLFEYSGKQGAFDLHWRQMYVLGNNNFYVLTFTAEEQQYARYLPVAERIFASFALK